jgi:hypothetical protein
VTALWLVPYLATGLAIEAWRWPRDRAWRDTTVRDIARRRTEHPNWLSHLRAHGRPEHSEEARVRQDVHLFDVAKGLLWPLALMADAIAWLVTREACCSGRTEGGTDE